jgi:hypothetical protein
VLSEPASLSGGNGKRFARMRVWNFLRLGGNDGVDCAVLLLQEFVFNIGQETERAAELSLPDSDIDV